MFLLAAQNSSIFLSHSIFGESTALDESILEKGQLGLDFFSREKNGLACDFSNTQIDRWH